MATVIREDMFDAHPDAPNDNDETLIRRSADSSLTLSRTAAAEDEGDDFPIERLIRSRDWHATNTPVARTTPPATPAANSARGLPIVVLTTDAQFGNQVRTALSSQHDVHTVESVDAAAEYTVAHRCPILVTDAVITRNAVESMTSRLRAHDPECSVIVSGTRDQSALLIGLQSSGAIDGFLLKPVTGAAAQIVVDAATRRHRSKDLSPSRARVHPQTRPPQISEGETAEVLVDRTVAEHAVSEPQKAVVPAAPTKRTHMPRASWPLVAAVAVAAVAITWWALSQRAPVFDPQTLIENHLALAEQAKLAGRWLDPRNGAVHHYQAVLAIDAQNVAAQRGLDRVAGELSRQTQVHMSAQRLADAALSLAQLRELQPDYPELPLLQHQLQTLQAAVAAATLAQTSPPTVTPPQKREKVFEPKRVETKDVATRPTPAPEKVSSAKESTPLDALLAATAATLTSPSPPPEIATPEIAAPTIAIESPPPAPQPPPTPPASVPTQRALLKYVPPVYPRDALSRSIEGSVTISLRIADDGTVIEPRVTSGENRQLFSRSALQAVRAWRYEPRNPPSPAGSEPKMVQVEFRLPAEN